MKMTPTALFTYNRSQNLQRTLDCLKNNKIDILYIFSDGPKNEEDKQKIKEVRKILDQINWVKTEKFYQEENWGLSESVIFGVNKVFEKYDTIICIEDDVCVANEFYEYMKACLERYRDNAKIAGVTGLRYPFSRETFKNYSYDVFVAPRFSSWGWGTWRRFWETIDFNRESIGKKIGFAKLDTKPAGADMEGMIKALIDGSLHGGWDVYCGVTMLLNKQYFVYPTWNMVENTGLTEGTHSGPKAPPWRLRWECERRPRIEELRLPDSVVSHAGVTKAFLAFFNSNQNPKTQRKTLGVVVDRVKRLVVKGFNYLGLEIKRKISNNKPDPKLYSTTDNPQEVPCQKEAYYLALNKYIKEGDVVLDVGMGIGYGIGILSILAKEVYGIDVDSKAVEYVKKEFVGKNPKVSKILKYNGYDIPFEDNKFDVVTCIDVIEHVEDYDRLIDEMLRVSKRIVFIQTPNRRPEYTNPDGTPKNYWHLREWSFEEFDQILKKHVVKVDWNFIDGPYNGPFRISKTISKNTLALTPVIYKSDCVSKTASNGER